MTIPEPPRAPDQDAGDALTVAAPTRLIRIAGVVHRVLEEIRAAPLDDAGRARALVSLNTCVAELRTCLDPALRAEMLRLLVGIGEDTTSDGSLRVTQASLVGWLDGLLEGVQAAWSSQFMSGLHPRPPHGRPESPDPMSHADLRMPADTGGGRYL